MTKYGGPSTGVWRPSWSGWAGAVGCSALVLWSGTGCHSTGGANQDVDAIKFTSIRPELELIARVREQEQKSKVGLQKQSSEERIFEERISLDLDGSVYHPNFLDFSLGGLFGLTQQHFEDTFGNRERKFSDDGQIYEFDFEGDFLKKKEYPGSVFARRHQYLEPRPFLSSLETTTENYGVIWQYVNPKMPTSVQFDHTDTHLDPLDDDESDGRQKNTNFRFDTAYRFTDQNVLSFSYNHQDVLEEPFELDYDIDEATLGHRLDFGDRNHLRLESELNYFDQRGTFDNRRTRWRETLRAQHTEYLRSWYQFEYLNRDQGSLAGVPPIREESYLLSATLEHQWYESLISRLSGYGQRQDFDSGLDIERVAFVPSLDYRKHNPWGTLLAAYRFRWEEEDRQGSGFSSEVVDEPRTFRDPEPIVLANTNVSIPSIFVTASDRLTVYRSGPDYRVRTVGERVELERVPTGRILDGETVLIDYVYFVGGDFKLDTVAHDFDVRQNFRFGLSPYYRFRRQDQDIDPRRATGILPEDIRSHLVGLEYTRGPVRAVAEYEDYDSNISPFDAVRLSAELNHRFDFGGTGRLQARWTDLDRSGDQDRETQFFTVEGRFRQTFRNQLTFESVVMYRTEEDSVSGDDEGIDVELSLEWVVRETELRIIYELGEFEDDFTDSRNSALFVQFRRRF